VNADDFDTDIREQIYLTIEIPADASAAEVVEAALEAWALMREIVA
jgi:hypothetical protein